MSTHVNDAGTWRAITEIHVNDNGTWRRILEAYVNDGGTWRLVFVGDQISIGDTFVQSSMSGVTNATAVYRLDSDGLIYGTFSGTNTITAAGGNWIVPATNMANYEVNATLDSGSVSGTFGSWLSLGTDRTWTLTNTISGTDTGQITVQIRRISDGTVMDSAVISFEASNLD